MARQTAVVVALLSMFVCIHAGSLAASNTKAFKTFTVTGQFCKIHMKTKKTGYKVTPTNTVPPEFMVAGKNLGMFNDGVAATISFPRKVLQKVTVTGNYSRAVQSFMKAVGSQEKKFGVEATGRDSVVALNSAKGKDINVNITGQGSKVYIRTMEAKRNVYVTVTGERATGTLLADNIKGKVIVDLSGDNARLIVRECETSIVGTSRGQNDVVQHEASCKCNVVNVRTGQNICVLITSETFTKAVSDAMGGETLALMALDTEEEI